MDVNDGADDNSMPAQANVIGQTDQTDWASGKLQASSDDGTGGCAGDEGSAKGMLLSDHRRPVKWFIVKKKQQKTMLFRNHTDLIQTDFAQCPPRLPLYIPIIIIELNILGYSAKHLSNI